MTRLSIRYWPVKGKPGTRSIEIEGDPKSVEKAVGEVREKYPHAALVKDESTPHKTWDAPNGTLRFVRFEYAHMQSKA